MLGQELHKCHLHKLLCHVCVVTVQDSAPGTPIFVFLSPGVDVAASVEGLGKKLGFTADTGHYSAVSLGQGQEPIAMNNLANAHKNGGWVLLQNIHLTIDWTSGPLEKKVDKLAEGAHKDFRYRPSQLVDFAVLVTSVFPVAASHMRF